ncbi:MAG: hypothetical protein NC408_04455 [Candidatus Gastranaerophilales bacterium]|nr:hypothetical protein [Candidatus Gastranaerophilales bacterium]MCM1072277.1 hypothetical protein [Bacteroides sp.]
MTKNQLFNYLTGQINQTPEARYYNYNLNPRLADFNRADTVNMSDEEMNKFRHVAGTKQVMNDWGAFNGIRAVLGKEVRDLMTGGDSKKDTLYDLVNDARGVKLYFKQPDLDETSLYNHVFNNYIKPYRISK